MEKDNTCGCECTYDMQTPRGLLELSTRSSLFEEGGLDRGMIVREWRSAFISYQRRDVF